MRYYVLCSCPRTGSGLVAAALRQMGLGDPQEFFNRIDDNYNVRQDFVELPLESYIDKIKAEYSVNGLFGIKTHYHQIPPAIVDTFPQIFPDAGYVFLTRRNVLRQALSWARATQTGAWDAGRAEDRQPVFERPLVVKSIFDMVKEIENWENFFARHGIKPLSAVYEDVCDRYEDTIARIISHILPAPEKPLLKQADATTEAWMRQFMALKS